MTDRPDFTGAGWHWSGGGEHRLVPKESLEELHTTLESALANLHKVPEVDEEKARQILEPLCRELVELRHRYAKLLRDYWHNIFRAVAIGALVAWVLWQSLGVSP